MAQIQNFGFVAPVQESDVQHPPRQGVGLGQSRRLTACPEHALCHPHHTGAVGQGLGGHLPFGHNYFQQLDRTLSAFQIPPSAGIGEAGYQQL